MEKISFTYSEAMENKIFKILTGVNYVRDILNCNGMTWDGHFKGADNESSTVYVDVFKKIKDNPYIELAYIKIDDIDDLRSISLEVIDKKGENSEVKNVSINDLIIKSKAKEIENENSLFLSKSKRIGFIEEMFSKNHWRESIIISLCKESSDLNDNVSMGAFINKIDTGYMLTFVRILKDNLGTIKSIIPVDEGDVLSKLFSLFLEEISDNFVDYECYLSFISSAEHLIYNIQKKVPVKIGEICFKGDPKDGMFMLCPIGDYFGIKIDFCVEDGIIFTTAYYVEFVYRTNISTKKTVSSFLINTENQYDMYEELNKKDDKFFLSLLSL